MKNKDEFFAGQVYHVYNRGNGGNNLFFVDDDYYFFLKKYERFISPVAETFAYCLMPNHFHFLIRVKQIHSTDSKNPSLRLGGTTNSATQAFSNFFNSYSKSFNKVKKRYGKIFNLPFKHICVEDKNRFPYMVYYIHRNPIHHGFRESFKKWKYSSYNTLLSGTPNFLSANETMSWFGGIDNFVKFHNDNFDDYKNIGKYTFD